MGCECCLSTQMQATLSQFPSWGLFLLTCCDVGPYLSRLSVQSPRFMSCTTSLRLCEKFCVTGFGGGTPQRDRSRSATKSECCSFALARVRVISQKCYRRISEGMTEILRLANSNTSRSGYMEICCKLSTINRL